MFSLILSNILLDLESYLDIELRGKSPEKTFSNQLFTRIAESLENFVKGGEVVPQWGLKVRSLSDRGKTVESEVVGEIAK